MKKALRDTHTLRAGCSKAEPKIFAPPQTPSRWRRTAKIKSAGDGHYLYLQTQFGEDRCTQFQVIVVTDPQTHAAHPPTHQAWTGHCAIVPCSTNTGAPCPLRNFLTCALRRKNLLSLWPLAYALVVMITKLSLIAGIPSKNSISL